MITLTEVRFYGDGCMIRQLSVGVSDREKKDEKSPMVNVEVANFPRGRTSSSTGQPPSRLLHRTSSFPLSRPRSSFVAVDALNHDRRKRHNEHLQCASRIPEVPSRCLNTRRVLPFHLTNPVPRIRIGDGY